MTFFDFVYHKTYCRAMNHYYIHNDKIIGDFGDVEAKYNWLKRHDYLEDINKY